MYVHTCTRTYYLVRYLEILSYAPKTGVVKAQKKIDKIPTEERIDEIDTVKIYDIGQVRLSKLLTYNACEVRYLLHIYH
jgi:hypothetical protein